MRVHTTASATEFAAAAGPWLAREPVANNVLLLNSEDPSSIPPGQGDPVFAWVTDGTDAVVGAGFVRLPYRATISDMPPAAAAALAEHVAKELELDPPGVNGPTAAAEAFADRFAELTGKSTQAEREQWIMSCTATARPENPHGRPRPATVDDLDPVAEWFAASMRDSGMTPEQITNRSRHMVGGQIDGGRLIVWEIDGDDGPVAVGAAGWNPPVAGVVRPSGVFVSPDHRSGGYATLVLGEVVARALEGGADACVCTHFLKYESMLAVVEKVGFRKLLDVTEYRFD